MSALTLKSFADYVAYCNSAATRYVQHIKGRYETQIADALLVHVVVELMKPQYIPSVKMYYMKEKAKASCTSLFHRMEQLRRQAPGPVECPEVMAEFLNFFP